MTVRGLLALLAPLMILALACGPAAAPDSGVPAIRPLAQAETPTEPLKPTPTPDPYPTKPTPVPPTPVPTKAPTADQPPAATLPPAHPEGLEGCKSVVLFRDDTDVAYQNWCGERLLRHVAETCSPQPPEAGQWQCGEGIVAGYDSFIFRYGAAKCAGISAMSSEKHACLRKSADDLDKGFFAIFEAWEKVRIGASRDAGVAKAAVEVMDCLESKGFEDVDEELLFPWQRLESPAEAKAREGRLSQREKDLRADLLPPTRDCAKLHGFYDTQDAAWTAELVRLDREERDTVADLIREGLLDALRKPGVVVFLTGERPQ